MNKMDIIKLKKERNTLIKELDKIKKENDILSLYLIKRLYFVSQNRLRELIDKSESKESDILKDSLEYEIVSNLSMLKTSNKYFYIKKRVKQIDKTIKNVNN